MNELERVRRAISRIEKGWTQGFSAKDADDFPVHHDAPQAACWCLIGALSLEESSQWAGHQDLGVLFLQEIYPQKSLEEIHAAKRFINLSHKICQTLWLWNDRMSCTQEEVLSLLRRVETRLLEKEASQ